MTGWKVAALVVAGLAVLSYNHRLLGRVIDQRLEVRAPDGRPLA